MHPPLHAQVVLRAGRRADVLKPGDPHRGQDLVVGVDRPVAPLVTAELQAFAPLAASGAAMLPTGAHERPCAAGVLPDSLSPALPLDGRRRPLRARGDLLVAQVELGAANVADLPRQGRVELPGEIAAADAGEPPAGPA